MPTEVPCLVPLALSDLLADQTTLMLAGLERDLFTTLPSYFGNATISLTVGRGEACYPDYRDQLQNTFIVHKELLCLRSRLFNAKLGRPFDIEVLAEALADIERNRRNANHWMGREGNPLLEGKYIPLGYTPLWISLLEQYRQESHDQVESMALTDLASDTLPAEHPRLFKLFVHWLYTGQIVTQDTRLYEPSIYASLYSLAERLDVPSLRHECYTMLRGMYKPGTDLPDAEFLGIIVNECSPKCALRTYVVQVFAYAVITKGTTDVDDGHLDLHPSFYDEVARQVTQQLRAQGKSQHPYDIETLNSDDSDFEVDTESVAKTSEGDSDFELDHVLQISDDEDVDSLVDGIEGKNKGIIAKENDITAPYNDTPAPSDDDEGLSATGGHTSTAEDDDWISMTTDDEDESAKVETSDKSEATDDEGSPNASDSMTSVKYESETPSSPKGWKAHKAARGRQRERLADQSSKKRLVSTMIHTADLFRIIAKESATKRKRRTPEDDEDKLEADKENAKRRKGKDTFAITDSSG